MFPEVVLILSSTSAFLFVSFTFILPELALAFTNISFISPIYTPPDLADILEFSVKLHFSILTPPDVAEISQY